ncbi:uncharacterized protein PV09_06172 [Verruconis gallopava]|uniref:UDP-glucose 6-dehydrogenase n=1 Tax=Verruconis gallopava TaxID=253628 RepID=A0A0D2A6Y1_9PEZI|nr:uncharacterized protein PV09_06172 [Verruconis gallopava]KIW02350.1 hypothetical protein PV09_06172 [Verruconis gallopava]
MNIMSLSMQYSTMSTPIEEHDASIFSIPTSPTSSSRSTSPEWPFVAESLKLAMAVTNVCIVGAGYVGGPTAAILALKNPHIQVNVVDKDTARIAQWNSKHLPVYEPGLNEIVCIARDGYQDGCRSPNLKFSTMVESCINDADIVFIAVNTPTKVCGIGAGAATNLAAFERAAITIAQNLKPGAIVVEKSTVPCGTAQTVQEILSMYRPGESFEVLSNPEFLAEGTAVKDLLDPDRVLIGSSSTKEGQKAAKMLRSLYESFVPPSKILTVNTWSSELAKLVANAMLAQRISSINSISAICEQTGADIDEISEAIGRDTRLGPKFLKAGVGFGGSCFKKDILSLVYLARSLHLPEVADYWMAVLAINDFQVDRFTGRVVNKLHGALVGKKITVLGFAFKQDTNDTRESPAINVVEALLDERPAEIAIFDPGCTPSEIESAIKSQGSIERTSILSPNGPVKPYINAYEACQDSSAILILTPWPQFQYPPASVSEKIVHPIQANAPSQKRSQNTTCSADCALCAKLTPKQAETARECLDWSIVCETMRAPKWVFDGRNIVHKEAMLKLGFRVENMGRA